MSRADGQVTLTVSGVNFSDVTAVHFYRNGSANTALTPTNVTVDSDSSLSVTANISPTAPLGEWVVVLEADNGLSNTTATSDNALDVVE